MQPQPRKQVLRTRRLKSNENSVVELSVRLLFQLVFEMTVVISFGFMKPNQLIWIFS